VKNSKSQIAKLIGSGFKSAGFWFQVQRSIKDLNPSTLNGYSRLGGEPLNLYRFSPSQNNKFQATSTKI